MGGGGRCLETALVTLAEHCKGLRRLDVEKGQGVTAHALTALARHCPGLESLNLNLCGRSVCDVAVQALAQGCIGLQEVRMCYAGVTDSSLVALSEWCKALRELDISETWVSTDETIDRLIQRCSHLQLLIVSPRFLEASYDRWSARLKLVIDRDYETLTRSADEDSPEFG